MIMFHLEQSVLTQSSFFDRIPKDASGIPANAISSARVQPRAGKKDVQQVKAELESAFNFDMGSVDEAQAKMPLPNNNQVKTIANRGDLDQSYALNNSNCGLIDPLHNQPVVAVDMVSDSTQETARANQAIFAEMFKTPGSQQIFKFDTAGPNSTQ